MKAFLVSDVRPFMRALLSDPLFHGWQFRSAELDVISSVSISGQVNGEYLTPEERSQRTAPYLLWEEIQPRVYALIQGSHTPTHMDIVLAMDPSRFKGMPTENVESLVLNIRYETVRESEQPDSQPVKRLTLVTGVSFKTFSLDKTPERLWDDSMIPFFRAHGIAISEM